MDRTDSLTPVLSALADPHRRQIVTWLRGGPLRVGALVDRLPLTQPGVTKHLGVLERAGLIRRTTHGRERYCELVAEGLKPVDDWVRDYRAFWSDALDRVATLAEDEADEHDRNA